MTAAKVLTPHQINHSVSFLLRMLLVIAFVLPDSLRAAGHEWTLAWFVDSNPLEISRNPESVLGLKIQDRIHYASNWNKWDVDANLVGLGSLEPGLIQDSKALAKGSIDLSRWLFPQWKIRLQGDSFQKLYLSDLQRSSRSKVSVKLTHGSQTGSSQSMGFNLKRVEFNSGGNYVYTERQSYLQLQHTLWSRSLMELDLSLGHIHFLNLPTRNYYGSSQTLVVGNEDQKDVYIRGTLHLQHKARFISGFVLVREQVHSNSILGESTTWLGKLYLSTRLGRSMFVHLVLQGMDKNYRLKDLSVVNYYRDPEELIQNQIHCQLERILSSGKTIYIQYSFLKNETILNHYYYEKQILEAGLKLDL